MAWSSRSLCSSTNAVRSMVSSVSAPIAVAIGLVRHEGQEATHGHELRSPLQLLGDRPHELGRDAGDDRGHPPRVEMDGDVGQEGWRQVLGHVDRLARVGPARGASAEHGTEGALRDGGDQLRGDQLGDSRGTGQARCAGEQAVGCLVPEVTQVGGRHVGEVAHVGLVEVEQAGDLEDLRAYVESLAHPINALRTAIRRTRGRNPSPLSIASSAAASCAWRCARTLAARWAIRSGGSAAMPGGTSARSSRSRSARGSDTLEG